MLRGLPPDARRQAIAAYRLFLEDPFHPGLQFKRIGHRRNIWSVRVGLHYRAVGERNEDRILWYWIGTHAEYDQLLGRH
jgi:hypothetical protein